MSKNGFYNKLKIYKPLLDRLSSDHEHLHANETSMINMSKKELYDDIRKAIELVLNTRIKHYHLPEELEELPNSLLGYGLPDLTFFNLITNESILDLCHKIENTIGIFEPRLQNITVTPDKSEDYNSAILNIKIEGIFSFSASHISATYESSFDRKSYTFFLNEKEFQNG